MCFQTLSCMPRWRAWWAAPHSVWPTGILHSQERHFSTLCFITSQGITKSVCWKTGLSMIMASLTMVEPACRSHGNDTVHPCMHASPTRRIMQRRSPEAKCSSATCSGRSCPGYGCAVQCITLEVCCARLAGPGCHHPCGAQRAQRDVPRRVQRNRVWHIHLQQGVLSMSHTF